MKMDFDYLNYLSLHVRNCLTIGDVDETDEKAYVTVDFDRHNALI